MECTQICPPTTTCNKKTNMCTPKTVKCKRGTAQGKATKTCDLVPQTSPSSSHHPEGKRCPPGFRRNDGKCENEFIALCKKHIMVPTLDKVVQSSYLTHKDCTIFLVAEEHSPHTKCTELLDMFEDLIDDNAALPNPIKIDLMIELLQETTAFKSAAYEPTALQLNNIRNHFQDCITTRNCLIRVHWTDPTRTIRGATRKRSAQDRNVHDWLQELARSKMEADEWTQNKKITEFFNDESDIPKLLSENQLVVKEIEKASKINPIFTVDFCIRGFMYFYNKNKKMYPTLPWQKLVKLQTRSVMDFYVVARIIKSKMKHVIYYAGYNHVANITMILSTLDFKLIDRVDGQCM